ncbi:hypothetical protein NG702_13860 [Pseudarthrobacter sp. MDT3-28]|uniref:hypothetical protein n=1 Tax=Pseudarthrobacter raffinosi TaxID=2953651 RepID=UPI00208F9933|nr:hypothetical protein [Pseudarthrobacter sp. MDT3-28]MCO4238486.1 hypothetical protein [Pseudarthrobacter sp. MDT3-28]
MVHGMDRLVRDLDGLRSLIRALTQSPVQLQGSLVGRTSCLAGGSRNKVKCPEASLISLRIAQCPHTLPAH